jgi:hypothetical protein
METRKCNSHFWMSGLCLCHGMQVEELHGHIPPSSRALNNHFNEIGKVYANDSSWSATSLLIGFELAQSMHTSQQDSEMPWRSCVLPVRAYVMAHGASVCATKLCMHVAPCGHSSENL